MKAGLSLLLLFAPVLPGVAQESEVWEARITAVDGDVVVFPAGAEDGVEAEAGTPLEAGDRIETGAKSGAEIALEAESVMDLGPGTRFEIESLSVETGSFSLAFGSLVAKIKTLVARRGGFQVRTPSAIAAIRGTEFGLEVDDAGDTRIGVFDEGKLGVRALAGASAEESLLRARTETHIRKGRGAFATRRLTRLKRQGQRLQRLRSRRAHLKRDWKRLPPEARAALRAQWQERFQEKLKALSPAKRRRLRDRLNGKKRESLRRSRRKSSGRKPAKSFKKKIKKKFKKRPAPRGRPRR